MGTRSICSRHLSRASLEWATGIEPSRAGCRRQGRITIPTEFRKRLNIDDEPLFLVSLVDGELLIVPVRGPNQNESSAWLREFHEVYAPIREEILRHGISEEEVSADIDAAIAGVRAEQRAERRSAGERVDDDTEDQVGQHAQQRANNNCG